MKIQTLSVILLPLWLSCAVSISEANEHQENEGKMLAERRVQGSGTMQLQAASSASELVSYLVLTTGDIEVQNIVSSGHITQCAALYTQGLNLGYLFKKGPDNELETDVNGDYIPTTTSDKQISFLIIANYLYGTNTYHLSINQRQNLNR